LLSKLCREPRNVLEICLIFLLKLGSQAAMSASFFMNELMDIPKALRQSGLKATLI
jgi:hypothetical protein